MRYEFEDDRERAKNWEAAGQFALWMVVGLSFALYTKATQLVWGWFVVPLFPALPLLSFWQAYGLKIAVRVFVGAGHRPDKKDDTDDPAVKMGAAIGTPLLLIGAAWIARHWLIAGEVLR